MSDKQQDSFNGMMTQVVFPDLNLLTAVKGVAPATTDSGVTPSNDAGQVSSNFTGITPMKNYIEMYSPSGTTETHKILPGLEITGIDNNVNVRERIDLLTPKPLLAADVLKQLDNSISEREKRVTQSNLDGTQGGNRDGRDSQPLEPAPAAPLEVDSFFEMFERMLNNPEPTLEQKAAIGAEKIRDCALQDVYDLFKGLDPEQAFDLAKAISEKSGVHGMEYHKKNLHIAIDYRKDGTAPAVKTGITISPDGKQTAWTHRGEGCFSPSGITTENLGQFKLKLLQKVHR